MKLNQQQKKAIEYPNGPLMVIAGAGTGKTTVITERIKWLINKKGLTPSQILALTFTEKAAKEMEERVDQILPLGYSDLWISTFHSFCDRILRDDLINIGLNPDFQLMNQTETILFLRNHLFDFNLDYFRPVANPDKFLWGIIDHFSRLADEDITPEQYLEYAKKLSRNPQTEEEKIEAKKTKELAQAFLKYQQLKEQESVFDFSDLITYTLKLFRNRPNILKNYQDKFDFILVDEFQDTNYAQYELIKLLAPPATKPNLTVTGDDSQSIYRFRGAAVSNILSFKEDYHQSQMVVLTANYRSTQEILDRAYQLIKHNDPDTLEAKLGISKNLISQRKKKGKKIKLIFENRVEDEAEQTVKEIKNLIKQNYKYKDIAILVRANSHADAFTQALERNNIPFQFLGPDYLFRKQEVKNLIAYLRLLVNPADDIAFFKIASIKIFNISPQTLAKIRIKAKKENASFYEAAKKLAADDKENELKSLNQFLSLFENHLSQMNEETGGQIIYNFLNDSGLLTQLLEPNSQEAENQAKNIAAFFDKVKSFEATNKEANAFDLLDWINLRLELGEGPRVSQTDWSQEDAVNILTVHSAKGLEFPIVFITNLVKLRFPSMNRSEQIPIPQPLIKEFLPEGDAHEQEERRLFYVAMTRAKDQLFFTAAKFYGQDAKREKQLSPFVVESLGLENLKNISPTTSKQKEAIPSWQGKLQKRDKKIAKKKQIITYLSHSQINSFETCPLQYKYKYYLKLPTFPSPAQTTGNTIHRTLKEFYQKQILSSKKLSQQELINIFNQNWQQIGFSNKTHEQEFKKKAKNMLISYYKKELAAKDFPKIAALEEKFAFKISPGLKLGGIFDRVDILNHNQIEIIDYKTGSKIPSQKEVDKDPQLSFYALAAANSNQLSFKRPLGKIILSLYFLTDNLKISTKRTPEQIDEFRQKILITKEKIEASQFAPTPGIPFPCNFCEFKLLCQAWN